LSSLCCTSYSSKCFVSSSKCFFCSIRFYACCFSFSIKSILCISSSFYLSFWTDSSKDSWILSFCSNKICSPPFYFSERSFKFLWF
jgi:hypothetical protein